MVMRENNNTAKQLCCVRCVRKKKKQYSFSSLKPSKSALTAIIDPIRPTKQ